jgi:hypothetical protein
MTTTSTEEKSTYDKIIDELKNKIKVHAKEYVPRLATALMDENKERTSSDIVEYIKKDCGYWSRPTIERYLPDELKNKAKQEAGRASAEAKKIKVALEASGESVLQPNAAEMDSDNEKKPKSESFDNKAEIKKYEDQVHALKIRAETAETAARNWMAQATNLKKDLERPVDRSNEVEELQGQIEMLQEELKHARPKKVEVNGILYDGNVDVTNPHLLGLLRDGAQAVLDGKYGGIRILYNGKAAADVKALRL